MSSYNSRICVFMSANLSFVKTLGFISILV
nr:MAG TPA: hypothetical protein [Bacteriophage sp.]